MAVAWSQDGTRRQDIIMRTERGNMDQHKEDRARQGTFVANNNSSPHAYMRLNQPNMVGIPTRLVALVGVSP